MLLGLVIRFDLHLIYHLFWRLKYFFGPRRFCCGWLFATFISKFWIFFHNKWSSFRVVQSSLVWRFCQLTLWLFMPRIFWIRSQLSLLRFNSITWWDFNMTLNFICLILIKVLLSAVLIWSGKFIILVFHKTSCCFILDLVRKREVITIISKGYSFRLIFKCF